MEWRGTVTLALVLCAPAAAGCAAGQESPDAVGYVLLDREAQAAGRLAHGGWSGAPVLPVALDAGEPAFFSSPEGRTAIDLRPGMVAWVRGAGGAVEWRALRDDVSDDRLRVHGSRDAAAALAQRLAGQLLGPASVEPDVWTIAAPDVFDRSSFLAVPDGIAEISPDPKLDLGPAGNPFARQAVIGDSSAALPEGAKLAVLVGLYTAGDRSLFLDAGGTFSVYVEEGCAPAAVDQGRWHTEGERVVLDGAGRRTVLEYDPTDGDLKDPEGARFSSALVDSIIAAMPKLEEP